MSKLAERFHIYDSEGQDYVYPLYSSKTDPYIANHDHYVRCKTSKGTTGYIYLIPVPTNKEHHGLHAKIGLTTYYAPYYTIEATTLTITLKCNATYTLVNSTPTLDGDFIDSYNVSVNFEFQITSDKNLSSDYVFYISFETVQSSTYTIGKGSASLSGIISTMNFTGFYYRSLGVSALTSLHYNFNNKSKNRGVGFIVNKSGNNYVISDQVKFNLKIS